VQWNLYDIILLPLSFPFNRVLLERQPAFVSAEAGGCLEQYIIIQLELGQAELEVFHPQRSFMMPAAAKGHAVLFCCSHPPRFPEG